MTVSVRVGNKIVGDGHSTYIAGEIGINHNGSMEITRQLIDSAALAGCDAVKFQKRTPELAVPKEMRDVMRDTPWGQMTYMDYRHKMEFSEEDYRTIDKYCKDKRIDWFASVWDEPSIEFLESFDPVAYKIPSAALTDKSLLNAVRKTSRPVILSTGMSTVEQIREAVSLIGTENLILVHTTSAYPCAPSELNLRVINSLKAVYKCPIGYSGHEVGLQTTVAAVAIGATFIERHITLDRSMWGSDQAASVEPHGLMRLVRDIRLVETALGDGEKRVYDSELPIIKRLRRT